MSDLCKYANNAYTDDAPFGYQGVIVHTDPVLVAAFQATYPNGREDITPTQAQSIYGVPILTGGGGVTPPYIIVNTIPAGPQTTILTGTQTNSPIIDACGNRVSYRWVIFMVLGGPAQPAPPGVPDTIRTRRWIVGFETPAAEANTGGALADNAVSRGASRVPGGLGMRLRSNAGQFCNMTLNKYGAAASHDSWERFYLRPFQLDAAAREIWRCYGSAFPNGGIGVFIRSNGSLAIVERDQVGAATVLVVATPETLLLNRWNRIDAVVQFGTGGATSGRFRLWLNQVLIVDVQSTQADGLGQNGNHVSSDLGTRDTTHNLEIDFDDWINAEIPVLFNGLDWLSGSHVRHIKPAGDGAGRTGWTGDWRVALQRPPTTISQTITSAVDGARLELTADADTIEALGDYQLGPVAMIISQFGGNAGGVNATLGFSIGGVDNLQAITLGFSDVWNTVAYRPAGLTEPFALTPLNLLLVRNAGAGTNTCKALQASIECLGAWGIEDQPVGVEPAPDSGIHNGHYWEHVAYRGGPGAPPFGEVIIESGVYTGNGSGQDLPKAGPGHFLFVRRVTGGSSIVSWHAGMIAPHVGTNGVMPSENMVQSLIDGLSQPLMRVAGNNADSNANTSTYQWVLISDPAMRFLSCGAFSHSNPQTVAATNPLIDSTFYPEAAFFFEELIGSSAASRHWYKGVGHASANAQQVDAAETANVASFGLGTIQSFAPIHRDVDVAYCAFRRFDGPGNGGPGTEGCDPDDPDPGCVVGLTSYVGNGAGGNRNISVRLCGRLPLFAIVQPHNDFARFKDPSHVTTDTGRLDTGGNTGVATEIVTGGVDFITVGTTLNASGVVYDVFVIPGDVGGSGWGTNGVFYPVPPAPPCGPIWPPKPPPPEPPVPPGSACPVNFPTDS